MIDFCDERRHIHRIVWRNRLNHTTQHYFFVCFGVIRALSRKNHPLNREHCFDDFRHIIIV